MQIDPFAKLRALKAKQVVEVVKAAPPPKEKVVAKKTVTQTRGRPKKADALTPAERQARWRARKKAGLV